jgi:hypothetical protein
MLYAPRHEATAARITGHGGMPKAQEYQGTGPERLAIINAADRAPPENDMNAAWVCFLWSEGYAASCQQVRWPW